jgi:hypothetical protein
MVKDLDSYLLSIKEGTGGVPVDAAGREAREI